MALSDTTRISVIVTTFNRSAALALCLASLQRQTRPIDEIVIADDGSDESHETAIRQLAEKCTLATRVVRQPHNGFRAAALRNLGVRAATGDYLIFVDGDLIVFSDFVEQHLRYATKNRWLTGNADRLTPDETKRVNESVIRTGEFEGWPQTWDADRRDRMARTEKRFRQRNLLAKIFRTESRRRRVFLASMNCSMPRRMFEAINGYDELFIGWGYEDQDLGLRLQLAGYAGQCIATKARALHLYHEVETFAGTSDNEAYFNRRRSGEFVCLHGLRQHPIDAPPTTPA